MDIYNAASWSVPGLIARFLSTPKYFDEFDPYWQEQLRHPFSYEILDDHPIYNQSSIFDGFDLL